MVLQYIFDSTLRSQYYDLNKKGLGMTCANVEIISLWKSFYTVIGMARTLFRLTLLLPHTVAYSYVVLINLDQTNGVPSFVTCRVLPIIGITYPS